MNKTIRLDPVDEADISLRSIQTDDLEHLREWKNKNREFFFYKNLISPTEQVKWFEGYIKRANDFIFMVEYRGQPIGCMGFRVIENQVDYYNIILGAENLGKKGIMGKAMRTLISYARAHFAIDQTVKVLKNNPAVEWYKKLGFLVVSEHEDHFFFNLGTNFSPLAFQAGEY